MVLRASIVVLSAFFAVACSANAPVGPTAPTASPSSFASIATGGGAPNAPGTSAPVKPYKANGEGRVIKVAWASGVGPAPGVTSTFNGRCTVPSDFVITFKLLGEATHLGRFTGQMEHCSQLVWTPQGPAGATYSDGRLTLSAANDDTITGTYTNRDSGTDASGLIWFRDAWTITGGTGRFAGATGHGEQGGAFNDFFAMLAGAPVKMWMEGAITYSAENWR
ncbi:MAG: hypothetical protein ACM3NQ_21005 [Bacteroidales bacterium]